MLILESPSLSYSHCSSGETASTKSTRVRVNNRPTIVGPRRDWLQPQLLALSNSSIIGRWILNETRPNGYPFSRKLRHQWRLSRSQWRGWRRIVPRARLTELKRRLTMRRKIVLAPTRLSEKEPLIISTTFFTEKTCDLEESAHARLYPIVSFQNPKKKEENCRTDNGKIEETSSWKELPSRANTFWNTIRAKETPQAQYSAFSIVYAISASNRVKGDFEPDASRWLLLTVCWFSLASGRDYCWSADREIWDALIFFIAGALIWIDAEVGCLSLRLALSSQTALGYGTFQTKKKFQWLVKAKIESDWKKEREGNKKKYLSGGGSVRTCLCGQAHPPPFLMDCLAAIKN